MCGAKAQRQKSSRPRLGARSPVTDWRRGNPVNRGFDIFDHTPFILWSHIYTICTISVYSNPGNDNHSSIIALEILWTEEPGRWKSTGPQSQTWLSDWAHTHTHTFSKKEQKKKIVSFLHIFRRLWRKTLICPWDDAFKKWRCLIILTVGDFLGSRSVDVY